MVSSFVLAAALQAASGSALSCAMVLPNAEPIDFIVEMAAGEAVSISPLAGSVWPQGAVTGERKDDRILLGGRGGIALEIGRMGEQGALALLSRLDGRRTAYPLAVGRCQTTSAAATSAPFVAGGIEVPAFNPASWPEDCALLLSDGTRLRFDYTLQGAAGRSVRLESESLWGGQPVTVPFFGVPSGTSRFGEQRGPAGTERLIGSGSVMATIVSFSRIGDPSIPPQTGIGICGHKNVVVRAVRG